MKNEFDYLNDVRVDFSWYEDIKLTEQECINMKKSVKERTGKRISWKKCAVIAACVASMAILSQTALAQSFFANIIKSVSTGHNTFIQTEDMEHPIPDELKGKLFDENGNPLDVIRDKNVFDADGNAIDFKIMAEAFESTEEYQDANVSVSVSSFDDDYIAKSDEMSVVYNTQEELQKQLDFDLKVPEYLPEGYTFIYGEAYRMEENGDEVSGQYAMVAYGNGTDKFTIHERIINDETSYTTSSSGEIKEIEINGNKAVLDSSSIDWETDGVSVGIMGRGLITGDELIKMAESVK